MIADTVAPKKIVEDDHEIDMENDEDATADDSSQALVRISRGSRFYTSRVEPCSVSWLFR